MKQHLNHIITATAIIASAYLLSNAFLHRNQEQHTISVTGLGNTDFTSDLIVWKGSFNKKNKDLKQAYADLDVDREKIKSYLLSKGVKAEQMVFSAVDIQKEFDNSFDQNGRILNTVFTGYKLYQSIQIESKDVNRVEEISRQVSELINSGVEFYSEAPQYYYTKLAELKIKMIADATKDAQVRAVKIAENGGGYLGRMKNATMGVFQIVAQNSSEDYSWGGSFNTNAKNKTANITIKLEYEVE